MVTLAVYTCWPLLDLKMWGGHDAGYYPPRYVEFYHLLAAGDVPPRWAPDFSFGYGEPFFSFNPPLVYLLNAAIHRLGPGFVASENIEVLLLTIVAGLGMYRLSVDFCGRRGALVSAAAYVSAPYVLVNLYVRHSMPDFAAFAFLPFSFFGLHRYVTGGGSRFLLVGASGVALLILSSNPVALVTAPAWGLCILTITVSRRQPKAFARGTVLLALGLGLSAFFWLPAYVERGLVHTERLILPGYLSYWNHFVYLRQLFDSSWGYGDSVPGPNDGMSFSIGIMHLVLVVLALLLYLASLRRLVPLGKASSVAFPVFLGSGLVGAGAFLTTAASRPLWDHVTTLHYLQFPWRLLSLVAFGAALLAGVPCGILETTKGWKHWMGAVLATISLGAVLADSWGHARPNPDWQPQPRLTDLSTRQIAQDGIPVDLEGEFEPRWLTLSPYRPPADAVGVIQGTAGVRVTEQSPTRLDFSVVATGPARVRINIHYFQGWTLLEQGSVLPIAVAAPDDLMSLDITPGAHRYTMVFRDTPVRRLGNGLSILAALLLLCSPLWADRRAQGDLGALPRREGL